MLRVRDLGAVHREGFVSDSFMRLQPRSHGLSSARSLTAEGGAPMMRLAHMPGPCRLVSGDHVDVSLGLPECQRPHCWLPPGGRMIPDRIGRTLPWLLWYKFGGHSPSLQCFRRDSLIQPHSGEGGQWRSFLLLKANHIKELKKYFKPQHYISKDIMFISDGVAKMHPIKGIHSIMWLWKYIAKQDMWYDIALYAYLVTSQEFGIP